MNLRLIGFLFLLVNLAGCQGTTLHSHSESDISSPPNHLLVEGQSSPLNIHDATPGLSWHANVTTQAYYQIHVASSQDILMTEQPDLWDSGKVQQRRSLHIPYQGKPLTSNQSAYWRVRVWEPETEQSSAWSEVHAWQMGLIDKRDWQAQWIQMAQEAVAPVTEQTLKWMRLAADLENPALSQSKRATQLKVLEQLKGQPTAAKFRRDFTLSDQAIVSARLHSTAAGYYEIYINGQAVSERMMDPGQTDYDKRILYNTDVVNSLLKTGRNSLAVHLGSGWYNEDIAFSRWANPDKQGSTIKRRTLAYGQPSFIAQLEVTYADGSQQIIGTDERWKSHASDILKEGLFSGELFDANQSLDGWQHGMTGLEQWQSVKVLSEWPTQSLEPQLLPPITKVKRVDPVTILQPEQGVWVVDFGQNFTGVPTLNIAQLNLLPQQMITLRFAEWVDVYGNISMKSGGGAPLLKQVDGYIASGRDNATWTPRFTWHGFRYVEIRGLNEAPTLDAIHAHLIRSNVERTGHFESSDLLLNRIHETALWGYESNLMSVPMDCPIRERAGWTGDTHAAMITGNYNFDMDNFWRKYLGDFRTATFTAPAVVPGRRTHGGKFDWAAAEIMIAWEHYRHHGDSEVFAKQYESMQEYMQAAESKLDNDLLRIGYGDWCDPVVSPGTPRVGGRCRPQHTTPTQTSSALLAHTANLMAKISLILDKSENAQYYMLLFERIKGQFNTEFFDDKTGFYGSQTSSSMALMFDIAPSTARAQIAQAIDADVRLAWNGHASVGALGQTYLYRALSDYGHGETAFNIFLAEGYPGYRYLFEELNTTTIWERKGFYDPSKDPNGTDAPGFSLNHPFHTGYDGWFYEGLGGLRPLSYTVGFQDFALSPVFVNGLSFADVKYRTGYGDIRSQWQRDNGVVKWTFTIPSNSSALVLLPKSHEQYNGVYKTGTYTIELRNI